MAMLNLYVCTIEKNACKLFSSTKKVRIKCSIIPLCEIYGFIFTVSFNNGVFGSFVGLEKSGHTMCNK